MASTNTYTQPLLCLRLNKCPPGTDAPATLLLGAPRGAQGAHSACIHLVQVLLLQMDAAQGLSDLGLALVLHLRSGAARRRKEDKIDHRGR